MKRNEQRQWILLGVLMLLGLLKSCNLNAQQTIRPYPEVRVYHLNDIYYVSGSRVHSESGRIDSTFKTKALAFDYLEELTVEEVKNLPRVILTEMKGSLLIYDKDYEQYYWTVTSSYYPYWSVDVTYERPSPKTDRVYIPVEAECNMNIEDNDSLIQGWVKRR